MNATTHPVQHLQEVLDLSEQVEHGLAGLFQLVSRAEPAATVSARGLEALLGPIFDAAGQARHGIEVALTASQRKRLPQRAEA